jgi:hypothetical protein
MKNKRFIKKKLIIYASDDELIRMEDLLVCVPLCKKHKSIKPDENMWMKCRDCHRIRDSWFRAAWKINGRLWKAMYP